MKKTTSLNYSPLPNKDEMIRRLLSKTSLRIVGINIIVFGMMLIVLELIFGSWLISENVLNNLTIRNNTARLFEVDKLYDNGGKPIMHSRDEYGLRGKTSFSRPQKIDILTVGGSTTEQRYIDDEATWQVVLEEELGKRGRKWVVANAGIDGQSTVAHIKSFELWFPIIENLKPKYVLFYVGINDFFQHQLEDDIEKTFVNKLKDKSALWNLLRKLKGITLANRYGVTHIPIDFDTVTYTSKSIMSKSAYPDFFSTRLTEYENRLRKLVALTIEIGAEPIFITQPTALFQIGSNGKVSGIQKTYQLLGYQYNGLDYYHLLNVMNQCIYRATKGQYHVIDLTNEPIWGTEDYYDIYHMSPAGTRKLGKKLAEELVDILR